MLDYLGSVVESRVVIPSYIPKKMRDVLALMLQKDKEKRPSAMELLCHSIFH